MVESVACYGCEVWLLNKEEQRKLLALKMDYLRSARMSRLQKSQTPSLGAILVKIQRRQLKWYGHLLRREDSRGLTKICQ